MTPGNGSKTYLDNSAYHNKKGAQQFFTSPTGVQEGTNPTSDSSAQEK
jgi:hypothetical protein